MTTTTKTTKRASVPWLRYSADVDDQLAAHGVTDESIDAYVRSLPNGSDPAALRRYRTSSAPVIEEFHQSPARPAVSQNITKATNGASPKQVILIDKLLGEKVHTYTEEQVKEAKADWRKTRPMIDFLLAAPRRPYQALVQVEVLAEETAKPAARLDFSAIPDGNYAIRVGEVVKFYRVSTNKGFKNVQVRASDQLFMQYGRAGIAILHRIVEAGLAESRMLFVTELDRCCKCGRSLTDEESRANARVNGGYGPDCVGK